MNLLDVIMGSLIFSIPFFINDVIKLKKPKSVSDNRDLTVQPLVSIIIPAWNEEEYIEECISSVIRQSYDKKEIIVVAGGEDDTFKIAKSFEKHGVKVIKQGARGKNAALNKGVRASKGEIIVTLDADCIAPDNWLIELIKPFENENVKVVTGAWKSKDTSIYAINNEFYQEVGRILNNKGFWSSNTAFRREVLEKINFFDENIPAGVELDLYLTLRKIISDKDIVYNKKAFVYTYWPSTFISFFKTSIRWARAQLEIFKKHGLCNFKSFINPKNYLMSFPFFISAVICLVPVLAIILFYASHKLALGLFYFWLFVFSWKTFRITELAILVSIGTRKIYPLIHVYVPLFTSYVGYITNTIALIQFLLGKKQEKIFEHGR
jgi:cellulose synthase/poly-beta-1,6-N-acetylglucosamine synthase-like glycosyltransferase